MNAVVKHASRLNNIDTRAHTEMHISMRALASRARAAAVAASTRAAACIGICISRIGICTSSSGYA